jgi:hypothetical protein
MLSSSYSRFNSYNLKLSLRYESINKWMSMFKVKIIRYIYDGSSSDDSRNYAATSRDIDLPIPPFVGMIVLMPYLEEIEKIMVNVDTQEITCILNSYYANKYRRNWDFQKRIDEDVLNGMTLIFNKPIFNTPIT